MDDLEETSNDGGHQDSSEQVRLDEVRDKQARRLLIKSEFLFQDKSAVYTGRHAQRLRQEHKAKDKDNRMRDFTSEARRRILEQQVAGPGPQLGHYIEVDKGEVDNLAPEAADDGELGFGTAIGLRLVKGFLVDFFGEDGGGFGQLEDTVLAVVEQRFEDILADGEAQNEPLPWEQRAIEELRQALRWGEQKMLA